MVYTIQLHGPCGMLPDPPEFDGVLEPEGLGEAGAQAEDQLEDPQLRALEEVPGGGLKNFQQS